MLFILFAIGLAAAPRSFAAIYKYIDKNGIVCFADDLHSIPETCRATAKLVSGEREVETKPLEQNQVQSQMKQEKLPGNAELSVARENVPFDDAKAGFFRSKALISIIVVVSALFAFVVLGILDTEYLKTVRIARIVIIWGVTVYLLYAHAMDVVHLFRTANNEFDSVQHRLEEKGKNAGKAIKTMNELADQLSHSTDFDPSGVGQEKRD